MTRVRGQVLYSIVALIATYCVHWLDLTLAGKVAPAIANSFGVSLQAMTLVFTASRIGLVLGAILGGIAGDRWGRKQVMCVCLGLAAVLSLATPLVSGFSMFAGLRGVSGLLLGGAGPCALALVTSVAPEPRRSLALVATLAGASIGTALGSLLVYLLVDGPSNWRSVFFISGIALAVVCLLVFWWVTETRFTTVVAVGAPLRGLLGPLRPTTILLGMGFFLSMGLNALLASWLPSFFHALANVPVQRFAGIVVLTAPSAIAGMLVAGWLSHRMSMRVLLLLCFCGHGLALILIGSLSFASSAFIVALAAVSFGQAACQTLLNLVVVGCYPVSLLATAFGGAAAVGRAGGIFAPAIGALALDANLSLSTLFILLGIIPMAVGVLTLALKTISPPTIGYRATNLIHR